MMTNYRTEVTAKAPEGSKPRIVKVRGGIACCDADIPQAKEDAIALAREYIEDKYPSNTYTYDVTLEVLPWLFMHAYPGDDAVELIASDDEAIIYETINEVINAAKTMGVALSDVNTTLHKWIGSGLIIPPAEDLEPTVESSEGAAPAKDLEQAAESSEGAAPAEDLEPTAESSEGIEPAENLEPTAESSESAAPAEKTRKRTSKTKQNE